HPPTSTPFPYTTLFRSPHARAVLHGTQRGRRSRRADRPGARGRGGGFGRSGGGRAGRGNRRERAGIPEGQQGDDRPPGRLPAARSEEHTSELQSLAYLV